MIGHVLSMDTVKLAAAKAHLSALIDRVEAGESIQISRRGKLVAQLTRSAGARKRIDTGELRTLTDSMTPSDAENVVGAMRDGARY